MTGIGIGMRVRNLAPRVVVGMDETCRRQHPAKICRQHYRPVYYTTALHHEGKVTKKFQSISFREHYCASQRHDAPPVSGHGRFVAAGNGIVEFGEKTGFVVRQTTYERDDIGYSVRKQSRSDFDIGYEPSQFQQSFLLRSQRQQPYMSDNQTMFNK